MIRKDRDPRNDSLFKKEIGSFSILKLPKKGWASERGSPIESIFEAQQNYTPWDSLKKKPVRMQHVRIPLFKTEIGVLGFSFYCRESYPSLKGFSKKFLPLFVNAFFQDLSVWGSYTARSQPACSTCGCDSLPYKVIQGVPEMQFYLV